MDEYSALNRGADEFESLPEHMEYFCDAHRHLVCVPYSVENLHKMAEKLEIDRCWFHKDHYDIPKKRINEITEQCTLVSKRRIFEMIHAPVA